MAWNKVFHFDKIVHDTDTAALAHGYYCVGLQILLRWVTDITALGYRYYCVGLQILLRRLAQTYP